MLTPIPSLGAPRGIESESAGSVKKVLLHWEALHSSFFLRTCMAFQAGILQLIISILTYPAEPSCQPLGIPPGDTSSNQKRKPRQPKQPIYLTLSRGQPPGTCNHEPHLPGDSATRNTDAGDEVRPIGGTVAFTECNTSRPAEAVDSPPSPPTGARY